MGLEINGNGNSGNQFDDEFWRKWGKALLESNSPTETTAKLQELYEEYGNPFQKLFDVDATVDYGKWFTIMQEREALLWLQDEETTVSEIELSDPPDTDGYFTITCGCHTFSWNYFKSLCPNADEIAFVAKEIPLITDGLTEVEIEELGDTEPMISIRFRYHNVLKLEKPAK